MFAVWRTKICKKKKITSNRNVQTINTEHLELTRKAKTYTKEDEDRELGAYITR